MSKTPGDSTRSTSYSGVFGAFVESGTLEVSAGVVGFSWETLGVSGKGGGVGEGGETVCATEK